eukprot:12535107-Alexandrium_andersonii.AAC.1
MTLLTDSAIGRAAAAVEPLGGAFHYKVPSGVSIGRRAEFQHLRAQGLWEASPVNLQRPAPRHS